MIGIKNFLSTFFIVAVSSLSAPEALQAGFEPYKAPCAKAETATENFIRALNDPEFDSQDVVDTKLRLFSSQNPTKQKLFTLEELSYVYDRIGSELQNLATQKFPELSDTLSISQGKWKKRWENSADSVRSCVMQ